MDKTKVAAGVIDDFVANYAEEHELTNLEIIAVLASVYAGIGLSVLDDDDDSEGAVLMLISVATQAIVKMNRLINEVANEEA
jgi:hypothetical protein